MCGVWQPLYIMVDVLAVAPDATHDVSPVGFDWKAFRAACRRRGAATVPECAALTGVPVRTLYEMRRRPTSASVGNALQIRAATGIDLDELFPRPIQAGGGGTDPRELDLARLPGKATSGGHVYALSFDNGTVKVGSTTEPSKRIRSHHVQAAQFGIAIIDFWVSPELHRHVRVEKRLIGVASTMCTGVTMREWFRGVDFRAFVEVAQSVTAPNPEGQSATGAHVDTWTRVKEALDVNTNAEAAARCGVPLRTLDRMFVKPGSSLVGNVRKVSRATGISMDDLFPASPVALALAKAA